MFRQKQEHGFTLIELVVSLTIFSVVSLSIYSSFASGISVWRKSEEFSSVYQTARLLLGDVAMELKNAIKVSGTEFNGGPRNLSFVTSRRGSFGSGDSPISKVTFEVRRDTSGPGYALFRRQATNLEKRGEAELMVGSLDSLDFQYTYQDPDGQVQPWTSVWKFKEEVPLGVRITLALGGTRFTKTVFIPHGFREEQET